MRKRLRAIAALIVLVIVAGLFCSCNGGMTDNVSHYEAPVLSESVQASDKYYVSPLGSDSGAGTVESPFKTLQCAMLAVNKFKAVMNCDMSVLLMDGTTYLDETLELTYEDNLPGGHTLTIESYDGQATISGGRAIGNWVRTSLNGLTVYKALISDVESVRGFSVNGQRMEIASAYAERNALNKYNNLLGWNWGDDEQRSIKVTTSGVSFASVRNPSQLEVGMICEWKTFIIRVAEVIDDRTLGLLQPYASWFTTPASVGKLDPGGYWFPNPKHGIWLQNDVSLIDSEGEWCFDRKEKCIYYCPPDGRDPNGDVCVISNLDKIVTIYGGISEQNRQEPVRNIVFRNLGFENGGHTQLDTEGLGMVQGQSYYSGVTEAESDGLVNVLIPVPQSFFKGDIHVKYADNINFENCYFSNSSKACVDFDTGTKNSSVTGCVFRDLGDAAVVVSNGHQSSVSLWDIVDNITIKNNLIRRTGRINQTSSAINVYLASNVVVEHNDIYDAPNTGISVGWGWYVYFPTHTVGNRIGYNRIGYACNSTRDGGSVYTLGKATDGMIYGNYLYNQMSAYGGIYIDEGSCDWTVTGNLVDNKWNLDLDEALVWLRLNGMTGGPGGGSTVYSNTITGNYYTNIAQADNGNHVEGYRNVIEDNTYMFGTAESSWPEANESWEQEAKDIFYEAGLEESYRYLLEMYQ